MKKSLLHFWVASTVLIFGSSIYCTEDETIPNPPRHTPLRERLYQKATDIVKSASNTLSSAVRAAGRPFGLGKHQYESRTLGGLTIKERAIKDIPDEEGATYLDLSRKSYKGGHGFGYGSDKVGWGFLENGKLQYGTDHKDPILQDMEKVYTVAEHRGRRQGAYNTVLAGATIGVVGYGLYGLYNWYRGNLHGLKKNIKAAEANIDHAIKRVAKENVQGSKILIEDINNAKTTLLKIYTSIQEEELRRKKLEQQKKSK